ncbi:DUF2690 domain-containing protein [Streptomyces sp. NPDC004788]
MGQPDQVNEGIALSTLLRQWWQSDEQPRKQEWVVVQLGLRGINLTQATLSRYLDPAKPQIAREDVVRALHEIFGRPEAELTEALELWRRATRERTDRQRVRATPEPVQPVPVQPAPVRPEPVQPEPVPEPDPDPVSRLRPSRRGLYGGIAAALVLVAAAGALWLNTRSAEEPVKREQGTGGAPVELAACEGEKCFGLEPNHTLCKNDAVTARVDTDPVISVELRYSAACRAAWTKISNTTQGDVAQIGDQAGRKREYTQVSGRDAHTTMLPVGRPEDATACAVMAARKVCATIPAGK